MAVSRDMLFPVLRSFHDMRTKGGFSTNMRVLRALMEHGPHDERVWLQERWTDYASHPDVFAFVPVDSQGSCWINPRGTIFSIRYGGHERFSYLVTDHYNTGPLEKAGWIHVSDKRIDLEYDPTGPQQKAVDMLQERHGYRLSDMRSMFKRIDPEDVAKIPPALHNLGMLSEYDWEDQRWWEARDIPRVAHKVSPPHESHTAAWRSWMYDAVYNQPREYWTPERIAAVAEHSRFNNDGYVPYRLEQMERGEY